MNTNTTTDLRAARHPTCVVCSPTCTHGLKLTMTLNGAEAVGSFACDAGYEGYPGMLHGGIISALLDGAMTNCLFLHGHAAVTAELTIRFREPVRLGAPAELRSWITEEGPPVFRLQARLAQAGKTCATARAAFMLPRSDIVGTRVGAA